MAARVVLLLVIGYALFDGSAAVTNTTTAAVNIAGTAVNTATTAVNTASAAVNTASAAVNTASTAAKTAGTASTVKTVVSTTSASKQTTAATTPQSAASQLVNINGQQVRLIDNCTVGVTSTCHFGYCCTKKYMTYSPTYIGDRPVYQLECKPLRKSGEFCYFNTPEQFCPCASRCHTNGFYGSCL